MKLIIDRPQNKDGESGSAFARRVLRDNIMRMRLEPGEVLNEALLAEELGLSRTPVREALFTLKDECLVEVHPHRASIVTLIDFSLVREGYFARCAVEPAATGLACGFLTPGVTVALERVLAEQGGALENGGDPHRFHALNQLFHRTIFEAGGMAELWSSVNAVTTHYDRLRYFEIMTGRDTFRNALAGHRKLLAAMLAAPDSVPALARSQIFDIENIEEYITPDYRRHFRHLDSLAQ